MRRSEQINELIAAIAAANARIEAPAFDKTNPHFKNKYASLAALRNAVVPAYAENKLVVMQSVALDLQESGMYCVCETSIAHASGQWIQSEPLRVPVVKNDAQGVGSAITYAKRYSLQAITCIVGDDDDDAEGAVNPLIKANAIVRERFTSIAAIKQALLEEDFSRAKECFDELTDEEKRAIWIAPTNGGIFTTEERAKMKSDAWAQANK